MTLAKTFGVAVSLALAAAILAEDGPGRTPASKPASGPASLPASAPVYTVWPFDSKEAARRQDETAKALGLPKELTLDLGGSVTMKLVLIPAGKFTMGSPDQEQKALIKKLVAEWGQEDEFTEEIGSEGPQHEVTISQPFYMSVYPVTQAQYEQVAGRNPSVYKAADNPVEAVTWLEARGFCRKVSGKTGKAVRLPTEAQWEWAARAGTATPFHTGRTISTDQANYDGTMVYGDGQKGENRRKTTSAGAFKPNPFGLYDMHGNVWQWCADWYGKGYYAVSSKEDPRGPSAGEKRVLRGGCWCNGPWCSRSAARGAKEPDFACSSFGFRVAVLLSEPAIPGVDTSAVAILIRRLGDDKYQVREEATAKLIEMGEDVCPLLEAALKEAGLDPEAKHRIALVLRKLGGAEPQ